MIENLKKNMSFQPHRLTYGSLEMVNRNTECLCTFLRELPQTQMAGSVPRIN